MARSRRLIGRRILLVVFGSSAAAMLLASLIILANGVVNLRLEIDELQAERARLEAQYAERVKEWNRVTARDVIVARAKTELDLEPSDSPGRVIVMRDGAKERRVPAWQRLLGNVGEAEHVPAVAAQSRWP
jgi:hypothetical protein